MNVNTLLPIATSVLLLMANCTPGEQVAASKEVRDCTEAAEFFNGHPSCNGTSSFTSEGLLVTLLEKIEIWSAYPTNEVSDREIDYFLSAAKSGSFGVETVASVENLGSQYKISFSDRTLSVIGPSRLRLRLTVVSSKPASFGLGIRLATDGGQVLFPKNVDLTVFGTPTNPRLVSLPQLCGRLNQTLSEYGQPSVSTETVAATILQTCQRALLCQAAHGV